MECSGVYNKCKIHSTDSWEIISHMTTGRYRYFAAVLPDKRLMVVGGIITEGSSTDTVEFMSMCN